MRCPGAARFFYFSQLQLAVAASALIPENETLDNEATWKKATNYYCYFQSV